MPKTPAFNLSPKQKGWKFYPTELHYKAEKWCKRNGYKIYPVRQGRQSSLYKICIEFAKKKHIGQQLYDEKDWNDKIWELELEIYKKHSKNDRKRLN